LIGYGDKGKGREPFGRRVALFGALALACLALAGCSSSTSRLTSRLDPKYGVSASPRVIEPGQPVPKGGGVYRVGKPYVVGGQTYTPEENRRYRGEGLASWYGDDFHGRLTANGEIYDMEAISAAHPTMPMPSYARVTNLSSGKSLIVRVNDRGPYHANREIDVSAKAADLLGFKRSGTARVRVEYVGAAPIEGTDDRQLVATLREGAPAPAPAGVMVASNRFLPNFGRPAAKSGAPLPQERPYDLGEGNGRVAEAYPQIRQSMAASRQPPDLYAERDVYAPSTRPRVVETRPLTQPSYAESSYAEPPARDARRLAAEALSRQPARGRPVETAADTPQTAYTSPRARGGDARNAASGVLAQHAAAAPPSASPVTAYAPVYFDGGAVSTGRGLY
jgi:rare lipoprotein A